MHVSEINTDWDVLYKHSYNYVSINGILNACNLLVDIF